MQQINASKSKEQCLSLQDDLDGKPVAKVNPIGSGCAALIGSMKGKLNIKGSLLSAGIRWDAEFSRPNAKS